MDKTNLNCLPCSSERTRELPYLKTRLICHIDCDERLGPPGPSPFEARLLARILGSSPRSGSQGTGLTTTKRRVYTPPPPLSRGRMKIIIPAASLLNSPARSNLRRSHSGAMSKPFGQGQRAEFKEHALEIGGIAERFYHRALLIHQRREVMLARAAVAEGYAQTEATELSIFRCNLKPASERSGPSSFEARASRGHLRMTD